MQFFCFLLLNIIYALMEIKYYLLTYLLTYFASHLNPPLTLHSSRYSSHIALQILTSFFFTSESLCDFDSI